MSNLNILILFIFFSLIFGVSIISFVRTNLKAVVANIFVLLTAIPTTLFALSSLVSEPFESSFYTGSFLGYIIIRFDALSSWFIIIINFTIITGGLYGIGYLKNKIQQFENTAFHWIFFLIFHQSMLWLCLIQNGFVFLVVWEIMSVSSTILIIYENKNIQVIKAGINYLVQMHLSIVFLTVGFLWLYYKTNSVNFSSLGDYFNNNNNIWLFLVFFVGFGIKAGFVPLHTWLPHAHPAGPSHISGVMSGVIVKLGIFGILRIVTFLKSDFVHIGEIILTVAIFSGLYGILQASVQKDFKKMLAYCTIENVGIIGIGIGIGLIGIGTQQPLMSFFGFVGALIHVLNHALYKSLLFYASGYVYKTFHTRNINKLGGVIKYMPKTAFIFLIGSVAIIGLPPLNGFVSEFLIYSGLFKGISLNSVSQIGFIALGFVGISIMGGLALIAFSKIFSLIFLGNPRENNRCDKPGETSSAMLIPQYLIIFVMIFISLFPGIIIKFAKYPVQQVIHNPELNLAFLNNIVYTLSKISLFSFIFILLVLTLLWLKHLVSHGKIVEHNTTWGCGYTTPIKKAQYSGESFVWTLVKSFNFVFVEQKSFNKFNKAEIFPTKRKYTSHFIDIIETRIISPVVNKLLNLANIFKFVQNGRIQSYVLYGIIFILMVLLISFLKIF